MAESVILQEVEIAKSEATKLISDDAITINELNRLRKNIDDKRKEFARIHRLAIKEIDELFAAPILKLKNHSIRLSNKK